MAAADDQYTQTIKAQRDYLVKLQDAFNKRCDDIAVATNLKLKAVPETDTEGRKKIFDEQKQQLDEALNQLKKEVNRSGGETRKKLEELYTQREAGVISNLENDMKTL